MALLLIAEDNDAIAELWKDFLTSRGHQVVRVDNGSDAVLKTQEWKPHLIIMDIMMPGLYGAAAYKALGPFGVPERIPVVFVTAAPLPQARKLIGEHPRIRLLAKPIELALLDATVTELLA